MRRVRKVNSQAAIERYVIVNQATKAPKIDQFVNRNSIKKAIGSATKTKDSILRVDHKSSLHNVCV